MADDVRVAARGLGYRGTLTLRSALVGFTERVALNLGGEECDTDCPPSEATRSREGPRRVYTDPSEEDRRERGSQGRQDCVRTMKTKCGLDLLALIILLLLVSLFYHPEAHPLQSRYVYFADAFERAAHLVNPEYDGTYQRHQWEGYSPFSVLWARCFVFLFPDDLGLAVLVAHMGLVLVAATATFLVGRLYLSTAASFLVATLLFCGRVLLPLARGMGRTEIHLLIPLSLLFLVAVSHLLDGAAIARRKWAWIALASTCLACIYLLGCHETLYAATCLGGVGLFFVGRWLVRSVRVGRLLPGPPRALMIMLFLAAFLGIGLMAAVRYGIPKEQNPEPFPKLITYRSFAEGVSKDVRSELSLRSPKIAVYRGTFLEGRYLTEWGRHHENTFLHPGRGFNGILPLFLLPGLAIGLVCFFRGVKSVWCAPAKGVAQRGRFFILFLLVLLLLFIVMLGTTGDPKPTRYTYCAYALYVLAAWGYERLARWINARLPLAGGRAATADEPQSRRLSWPALGLVILPLLFFGGLRLHKNYRDLQSYFEEYAHQIPTIALAPALEKALAEAKTNEVAIYCPAAKRTFWHPAVGLWMKFQPPGNIRVVSTEEELAALPPETKVVVPETMPHPSYYWVPRHRWHELDAGE